MQNTNMLPTKQYFAHRLEQCIIKQRRSPRSQLSFRINITNHCNLNCAGCSTFSPLAKEYFLDTSSFAKDCSRISELTHRHCRFIGLVGGEPLLHPMLIELITIARQHFDANTRIMIVTNGILLCRQSEKFWQSCASNAVDIGVSNYPIPLNMEEIKSKSAEFGVKCGYFIHMGDVDAFDEKTTRKNKCYDMARFPLDVTGSQDMLNNFTMCGFANSCISLLDGRLYTCNVPPYVSNFNDYFSTTLPVTDEDSIDIYRVRSVDEIFTFLSNPIPFCKYCNVKGRSSGHKWQPSQREITEWT